MIDRDIKTPDGTISQLLKAELQQIQKTSPKYSMRSFAKKLGVSQTELSEVINRKRKPSSRLILSFFKICSKTQAEYLGRMFSLERAGLKLRKKDKHLYKLEEQQFKMMAEWEHFAILSLFQTVDFNSDPAWIAKRIGSTKAKVEEYLKTLQYLRLIKTDVYGDLSLVNEGIKTSDEIASFAVREAHMKDLDLIKSVMQSPIELEQRDLTSCTYAVNMKNIKKFKKLVRNFQDQVADLLEDSHSEEVYRMSVYFYPLTQLRKKGQT